MEIFKKKKKLAWLHHHQPPKSDLIALGVLPGHQESLKAPRGDFKLQQSWRDNDLILKTWIWRQTAWVQITSQVTLGK